MQAQVWTPIGVTAWSSFISRPNYIGCQKYPAKVYIGYTSIISIAWDFNVKQVPHLGFLG